MAGTSAPNCPPRLLRLWPPATEPGRDALSALQVFGAQKDGHRCYAFGRIARLLDLKLGLRGAGRLLGLLGLRLQPGILVCPLSCVVSRCLNPVHPEHDPAMVNLDGSSHSFGPCLEAMSSSVSLMKLPILQGVCSHPWNGGFPGVQASGVVCIACRSSFMPESAW